MSYLTRLQLHILTTLIILFSGCQRTISPVKKSEVDKILILKSKRELQLVKNDQVVKSYRISLGANPIGHKQFEGDNKTPEGVYQIVAHNPNSKFYKSLRISYPNERDRFYAQQQGQTPGGDIMIHGLAPFFTFLGSWHILRDWTQGCIAVTNDEIDEIYASVTDGTPIELKP